MPSRVAEDPLELRGTRERLPYLDCRSARLETGVWAGLILVLRPRLPSCSGHWDRCNVNGGIEVLCVSPCRVGLGRPTQNIGHRQYVDVITASKSDLFERSTTITDATSPIRRATLTRTCFRRLT